MPRQPARLPWTRHFQGIRKLPCVAFISGFSPAQPARLAGWLAGRVKVFDRVKPDQGPGTMDHGPGPRPRIRGREPCDTARAPAAPRLAPAHTLQGNRDSGALPASLALQTERENSPAGIVSPVRRSVHSAGARPKPEDRIRRSASLVGGGFACGMRFSWRLCFSCNINSSLKHDPSATPNRRKY